MRNPRSEILQILSGSWERTTFRTIPSMVTKVNFVFLLFTLFLPFICRFIALICDLSVCPGPTFYPYYAFLMFEICGMHFCSVFCETLWIRLIATFQCGWLPFLDAADCHLSMRLIATFQFGWLPPFNLADCHTLFNSAWVPHNLGLGASLLIRPGCRCIDSADAKTFVWIQPGSYCYLSGLGAISFQSWQVGHFIQVGKFANL